MIADLPWLEFCKGGPGDYSQHHGRQVNARSTIYEFCIYEFYEVSTVWTDVVRIDPHTLSVGKRLTGIDTSQNRRLLFINLFLQN